MPFRKRVSRTNGRAAGKRAPSVEAGDVAQVAYELFVRRGRLNGYDLQDWFEAERIVMQRRRRRRRVGARLTV